MIISTWRDAVALIAPIFAEAPPEARILAIAHLDDGRRLIDLVVIPPQELEREEVPVRRIVEDALRLGATGLVLAHSQPGGDAQPSWDDINVTRELAETALRLGIRLHDHIIFAGDDVTSFRAMGLL